MAFFQHFGMESTPVFKYFDLEDFSFPLHLHRAYEFLLVRCGQLHIQVDDIDYHVNSRQSVIVFPNQIHGFDMTPTTKVTVVIFSPEFIGAFNEQYQEKVPVHSLIYLSSPINFQHTSTTFGIKSLLYGICDRIVAQTDFCDRRHSSQLDTAYKVLNYVTANFQSDCKLKNLSKMIGYDYSYLSKVFTKVMNVSFPEYLNSYRISYGRQLLKNTTLSVSQIAYKCGYTDVRGFNRNFKQLNQCTPQEFRRTVIKYDKSLKENYVSG
ncbi:AraC family transcriptional regulator [Sporolactobacillus shoreicorticis]|uniref:Helix-turn-helix domain-containing protein n=1 Tax=Sporolactobacillus shoreicorticis TaxID=1923877 RepID=A0ABW5RZ98_9BACL|nr:AraC family transcriptional regulator [Sporolactobacillus shoreicorticis]MCO7125164.1 AraC family transcriptional regulator [Sporolactobacillus shoreicorticis]